MIIITFKIDIQSQIREIIAEKYSESSNIRDAGIKTNPEKLSQDLIVQELRKKGTH